MPAAGRAAVSTVRANPSRCWEESSPLLLSKHTVTKSARDRTPVAAAPRRHRSSRLPTMVFPPIVTQCVWPMA